MLPFLSLPAFSLSVLRSSSSALSPHRVVKEKVVLLVQLLIHEDTVRLRNFLFSVERQTRAARLRVRGVCETAVAVEEGEADGHTIDVMGWDGMGTSHSGKGTW